MMKYVSLTLLTLQNAALIVVMRYVRTREGDMFFHTSAVVMQETFKCLASLAIIFYQVGGTLVLLLDAALLTLSLQGSKHCLKVGVPKCLW
jgi:UDP-sugar transporter A1/2/3